jgi:hypothetical protein
MSRHFRNWSAPPCVFSHGDCADDELSPPRTVSGDLSFGSNAHRCRVDGHKHRLEAAGEDSEHSQVAIAALPKRAPCLACPKGYQTEERV